jgi:hypothetical protein
MISSLSYREILDNNNNNYCNNSKNEVKSDVKLAVDVKNVVFLYKKNVTVLNNICVQIPEGMLKKKNVLFLIYRVVLRVLLNEMQTFLNVG